MADDNSWSSSNSKFFPFQLLFLASSFKTCNVYLCERMESTIAAKTFWSLQIWAGNPRLLKDSAILHTESCFVRPLPYARIPSNLAAAGLIMVILQPIYEYGVAFAANVQRAPLDMTASPPVSVMMIGTPRRIHKFRPCWTKPLGFSTTWIGDASVGDMCPFFQGSPWKNPRK